MLRVRSKSPPPNTRDEAVRRNPGSELLKITFTSIGFETHSSRPPDGKPHYWVDNTLRGPLLDSFA
jgi:hypothetical protein